MPLDGSNWQRVDLFDFQTDVEVSSRLLEAWEGDGRGGNVLPLDGSNWQRVDLFDFQTDVEVSSRLL